MVATFPFEWFSNITSQLNEYHNDLFGVDKDNSSDWSPPPVRSFPLGSSGGDVIIMVNAETVLGWGKK